MAIDSSGSQLKPVEHKSLSEKIGDKMRSIFTHRSHQSPQETLQALASLDTPSEASITLISETISDIQDKPIILSENVPLSQEDKSEIDNLTKSIKELAPQNPSQPESTSEVVKPPERTLFPDRPSLDELIAQDPNRKTKVPVLTRLKDIQTLKKSGVSDPSKIYDDLVKKGVPRGLILETKGQIVDYGQYGLYMKHYASYEDELKTKEGRQIRREDINKLQQDRKIIDANQVYDGLRSRGITRDQIMQNDDKVSSKLINNKWIESFTHIDFSLIKGIDRLDSIEQFDPKSFDSDYTFNNLLINTWSFSFLSDSVFLETKNKLNQYTFLPKDNLGSYFSQTSGLTPETLTALDFFKNNFFSNTQNKDLLSAVQNKSDYHYDRPDFAIFANSKNEYRDLFPLISTIARSDINNQERIELPPEILSFAREEEMDKINCLLSLTDRQQQIFFCENIIDFYPRESFLKKYFDENHQPNLEFYKRYLSRSEVVPQKITIPKNLLDSISDQSTKDFYQFISDISDGQIQHYILAFIDKTSRNPDSFFYEGKLTYQPQYLFRDILLQKNIINNPLKIEQIKDLVTSESDQRDILVGSTISDHNARSFFLGQYPEEREKFLDGDGNLNSYFYEQYIICNSNFGISNNGFLRFQLTPEKLATFSPEDQKFWQNILSIPNPDFNVLSFFTQNKDKNSLYFNQDHKFTPQLLEDLLKSSYPLQKSYLDLISSNLNPETISTFSPKDQEFWYGVTNLKGNHSIDYYNLVNFLIPNKENISQYFNNDHQPSKKLIQIAINDLKADFRFIKDMVSPEVINDPDFSDKIFFSLLSKIDSPETYRFFIESSSSISQKIISSPNPENYLEQYLSVIDQINSSPAKEILKIKNQLFIEILNTSNPLETYQKISDIFIKNNLPMVGKIYRVFDALYPSTKVKEVLSNPKLSRVLINSRSSHLRQSIIFNDLLKVNLGSGELSLVNYLTFLNQSASVLEKSRLGSPLSPSETHQLSFFFRKLDTLYDSSLLSRLKPQKPFDTSTLQTKVSELYQKYNVKEGQSISDRVAEMYLSGLGIKTIPEALSYIKQSKESAHTRNLKQTEFSLSPGDLIKGVNSENLGNILNFGCVAGEYLGSDAGSDATPFDTDTIKSDQEYAISDYQKIAATGYGDIFIVVKDRGQLQDTTDTASPKYDRSKLEIFKSGVVGQRHYGVRTGFPSSEIDFLITKSTDPKILENTFYEIAKHGVYIPVLNGEGQQIFTPTDYQRYRHSFDGVKQFSGDPLEIERSQLSDPFYQEIINFKKSIQSEPTDDVSFTDTQIKERIKTIFDSLNIPFKDQFDTSILGSRLYNIGSSGRHTNLPGDFDFDYNIVLDTLNYSKLNDIIDEVKKQFPHQGEISSIASQIRLTGVDGVSSESVDLDIGINTTASTLIFASHEAIEQKLDSIKQAYGEDTYQEVVANILLAKKILKENHAYKKGEKLDGGFGGIGTENWILSNNGSIKKAFDTFWQAAHDNGRELTLDEFRKRYFILDPGENLRETSRSHDNFIFALQDKGYKAMLTAIGKYVHH